MTWFTTLEPTVQVSVVSGIFAILMGIGGFVGKMLLNQRSAIAELRENSAITREQTQNSHKTNLRDDIDRVLNMSEQLLAGQAINTQAIADLRTDLAWERRERMDLARVVMGRTPIA